ncbi:nucleoporin Nup43 [Bombyx mandarina]|uniref:Nucleoporin Nup43 n=3 Tax=Bombyx TaxID=7090 RepID=A0A8R1WGT8_BOMMO|nr:nucleoporin Nup43 [Bombyx mori]XP_028042121.1 nucleoporin Nup43 [Bombyx mandarina]
MTHLYTKMSIDIQGTFVSQKINKVRWIPEDYAETKCFLTGSWDDEVNLITVWTFESVNEDEEVEYPRALTKYPVDDDVTQIKFTEKNKIAVSISNGDVKILEISAYDKQTPLKEIFSWKSLHNYGNTKCSATSLDTYEGDIASIGEDGNVNILSGRRGEVNRTIKGADSCSLHSICYLKHTEVITGNIRGHIKIWDLRSEVDKPAASFLLAGDELAATCIINHPTQPHIVLAGSESGSVAIWDLRMNTFPTSLLSAHTGGVTEMQFHPENPQKLLTCAVSGELWDWNMETITKSTKGPDNQLVWMPLQDKNTMMINSLMPSFHQALNSLDCEKGRILCGADNEAVYLIKNLKY